MVASSEGHLGARLVANLAERSAAQWVVLQKLHSIVHWAPCQGAWPPCVERRTGWRTAVSDAASSALRAHYQLHIAAKHLAAEWAV